MNALEFLDFVGVFVFALSGALVAVRKEMDLFGILVLAFMPAIGGGTLRDLLLDVPVFWLVDNTYLFVVFGATLVTFFGFRFVHNAQRLLMWFDAAGLSVFSVLGCAKALSLGVGPVVSVMMGVMTAVAGGVIRDVVANDIPQILQREIYATAALVGAAAFWVLAYWQVPLAMWFAIGAALAVRSCAIVWHWSLPRARG